VPVSASTPVPLLKVPEMPFWVTTASMSPLVNPELIVTVAPVTWVSSASVSVMVVSIAAAAPFSV
jgi:hypothetical protein